MNPPAQDHPEPSRLSTAQRLTLLLGLAWVFALQAMLWWIYYLPEAKALLGDEIRYWQVSGEILAGGDWHPSTIWPPLQPLFIALIRALGGGLWAVQLVQTLLLFASAWMLHRIAYSLTASKPVALLAALLLLSYPPLVSYALYLWPEILHLFLLIAVWYLLCCHPRPWYSAALVGALLGLALLTKNLLMLFLPFTLLLLIERSQLKRSAARVALAVLVLSLMTAPALYKGWQETGRPMIADSASFNLYVGLNDISRSSLVLPIDGEEFGRYWHSADSHREREAIYQQKIAETLAEKPLWATLAEQLSRQYFRLFGLESYLVMQFPGQPGYGYSSTYAELPEPVRHLLSASSVLIHLLLMLGAVLGGFLLRPGRKALLWLWLAFIAYNLGLFLLLHVKSRFVLPLIPIFCVFTAVALHWLWQRRQGLGESLPARAWWFIVPGMALMAVLSLAGPLLDGRGWMIAW